jgi:hypothetical protein
MAMTARAYFSTPSEKIAPKQEEAFFRSLKVRNRNTKQTGLGRLSPLNEALVRIVEASGRPLRRVLDVGVSSGVTTVDLHERLAAAGLSPEIVATDLSFDAAIVAVRPGCRALVDASGDVLQYDILGWAIHPWRRRLDYVSGMLFVRELLKRTVGRAAQNALAEGRRGDILPVKLVNPRLSNLPGVTVCEDDIFKENPSFRGRFDFIRAANVLNREYFEPSAIKSALRNLASYLAGSGALLAVGRTLRGEGQQATFFELDARTGRLTVLERIGQGSEIEDLVLSVVLTPAAEDV